MKLIALLRPTGLSCEPMTGTDAGQNDLSAFGSGHIVREHLLVRLRRHLGSRFRRVMDLKRAAALIGKIRKRPVMQQFRENERSPRLQRHGNIAIDLHAGDANLPIP